MYIVKFPKKELINHIALLKRFAKIRVSFAREKRRKKRKSGREIFQESSETYENGQRSSTSQHHRVSDLVDCARQMTW